MATRGGSRAGVRVPRALGALAAMPIAAIGGVLCALAVLEDGRAPGRPSFDAPAVGPSVAPAAPPRPAPRAPRRLAAPPRVDDGNVDPLPALLLARTSADEAARARAARGLGALVPAPGALGGLLALLDDVAPEVIGAAAAALARSAEGRRALVGRLRGNDPPALVHLACFDALREHGTRDELHVLVEWARGQGPAADAAACAARAVCARAGVSAPEGLPPLEEHGEPRPARD